MSRGSWSEISSDSDIWKKLVLGVIYNPIMEELCSAVAGGGAHLNGVRVQVGSAKGVGDALVCNNVGACSGAATPAVLLLESVMGPGCTWRGIWTEPSALDL